LLLTTLKRWKLLTLLLTRENNMLSALKKYGWNLLLSVDQLVNAVLAGDPDETISSRIGKVKQSHGGSIPWRRPVLKIVDHFLDIVETGHTVNSIETDEGSAEVWNWRRK